MTAININLSTQLDDFDNLTVEVINEQILKLRKQNFTWTAITRFFSVTRRKMQAYIRRHGIEDPYTLVEDNAETRQIIQQYVSEHHNAGEVVIKSYYKKYLLGKEMFTIIK